jgi:hypothetical protein
MVSSSSWRLSRQTFHGDGALADLLRRPPTFALWAQLKTIAKATYAKTLRKDGWPDQLA